MEAPHTESFIDQLYGELVESPESTLYKQLSLENGEVSHPSVAESGFITLDFQNDSPSRALYQLQQLQQNHAQNLRMASHDGYLKTKKKYTYPNDDDTGDLTASNSFGGIVTFGGLDTMACFDPQLYNQPIDIAIVGAPFDTGVSYRPGARFGPDAIRSSTKRLRRSLTPVRGNGRDAKLGKIDPFDKRTHNLTIIDCGDIPMTPFDNRIALNQLYRGQRAIHNHSTTGHKSIEQPKIITMGGDHTITLMALRSAYEKYGKIAVLHFDSHIDTWDPKVLGGGITDYMSLNHGTFLHYAAENGYLKKDECFHVGLRAPFIEASYDKKHDTECGFQTIHAREIDQKGIYGIVNQIKKTVGDTPVYISVDIDVLDPANAPGTGTMEIGGWTGRELLSVLDGLSGVNVIGGDVVEVSPPYDSNSEITSIAAMSVIDSILGLIIVNSQ